jgi:hypothetical protein
MPQLITLFLILFILHPVSAQFTGEVGSIGCEAISKESSGIVAWATKCEVKRGYLDKSDVKKGFVSQGADSNAVGVADNKVVSLGDSGVALLTFDVPIRNNVGPDFLVFENGFSANYLELAFVEVSSDGIHFFRFPAVSNRSITKQIGPYDTFGEVNGLYNLAGKYEVNYGTPFDLEELTETNLLDKFNIRFVKIIDVVGSIDPKIGSFDSKGRIINDPYPTDFAAGGFDLDAVAVFDKSKHVSLGSLERSKFRVFPNPATSKDTLQLQIDQSVSIEITNLFGQQVFSGKTSQVPLNQFVPGYYYIVLSLDSGKQVVKFLISE